MQSDVIAVSTSHLRPYLLDNLIQHKITEPVFPVIREIKVVRVKGHGARVLLAERPNRACPAVHFRVEAAPSIATVSTAKQDVPCAAYST